MSRRSNDSAGERESPVTQLKLAVLISGSGTNLQALINACAKANYPARISLVISNIEKAAGLARAKRANIPSLVIRHTDFRERRAFDDALSAALKAVDVDLICLAGFMRVLGQPFVDQWQDRIINIHPADTALHQGLNAYEWAFEKKFKKTCITIHYIDEGVDTGLVIKKNPVDLSNAKTLDEVKKRGLEVEHVAYSKALNTLFLNH